MSPIWSPITVGRLALAHRLAMAPMTRNKACPDGTGQRRPRRRRPQGFLRTHGMYTDAHSTGRQR